MFRKMVLVMVPFMLCFGLSTWVLNCACYYQSLQVTPPVRVLIVVSHPLSLVSNNRTTHRKVFASTRICIHIMHNAPMSSMDPLLSGPRSMVSGGELRIDKKL